MPQVDCRSKVFQEVMGLDAAINSLNTAQKNVPAHIMSERTRNVVNAIVSCVRTHKQNPNFPREQVRMLSNNFREALEKRDPRETSLYRDQIYEMILPWLNKPSDIMIGS